MDLKYEALGVDHFQKFSVSQRKVEIDGTRRVLPEGFRPGEMEFGGFRRTFPKKPKNSQKAKGRVERAKRLVNASKKKKSKKRKEAPKVTANGGKVHESGDACGVLSDPVNGIIRLAKQSKKNKSKKRKKTHEVTSDRGDNDEKVDVSVMPSDPANGVERLKKAKASYKKKHRKNVAKRRKEALKVTSDSGEEAEVVDVSDMLSGSASEDERVISNMRLNGEPEYEFGEEEEGPGAEPADRLNGEPEYESGEEEEDSGAEPANISGSNEAEFSAESGGFREDIANMPLGKAKLLKEKLGLRLFNKAFFNVDDTASRPKPRTPGNFKRENLKRPREMSSKKPVSKFRNVYGNESIERKRFDPRFDERCGAFDEHIYETNFGFLDEIRQKEKQMLKKEAKVAEREDPEKAYRLKETLRKIDNREKSRAEAERRKEVIRSIRQENNERLRQGLRPVYRTRAQVQKEIMEKKYEELKKTHKLDKYIERRARKQNKKKNLST